MICNPTAVWRPKCTCLENCGLAAGNVHYRTFQRSEWPPTLLELGILLLCCRKQQFVLSILPDTELVLVWWDNACSATWLVSRRSLRDVCSRHEQFWSRVSDHWASWLEQHHGFCRAQKSCHSGRKWCQHFQQILISFSRTRWIPAAQLPF